MHKSIYRGTVEDITDMTNRRMYTQLTYTDIRIKISVCVCVRERERKW